MRTGGGEDVKRKEESRDQVEEKEEVSEIGFESPS
jgi:hypothetical protein